MLCSALQACKSAGVPQEYLNPLMMSLWVKSKRMPRADFNTYLAEIESRRTTPNGVFGNKVHLNHWLKLFSPLGEAAGLGFLKSMDRLIFLDRKDKLAQAMSWTFAKRTMVFNQDISEAPVTFNHVWSDELVVSISRALAELTQEELGWRQSLEKFRLPFLAVTYEDLVSRPETEMARILDHLGLDPGLVPEAKPRTVKLNSAMSDIRSRYLAAIGVKDPAAGAAAAVQGPATAGPLS